MDAVQRAVLVPSAKIIVHRAARRQVLRQRSPLAASAENIHDSIDHAPLVHRPLVAARLRSRDQWRNERPLRVRQVARVSQLAAVILTAILLRPHPPAPANRPAGMESHVIPMIQDVSGWTLRQSFHLSPCPNSPGHLSQPGQVRTWVNSQWKFPAKPGQFSTALNNIAVVSRPACPYAAAGRLRGPV